jgi:molecular chaperone GrpE
MVRKDKHHSGIASREAPLEGNEPKPEVRSTNQVGGPGADEAPSGGPALVEQPDEAVQRLKGELEEARDRYLRLAAEYENFRKRTARERSETWSRAQAEVVSGLVDAIDDLGRVSQVDAAHSRAESLLPAVQMIERKVLKQLESAGLERVGASGEPFDPSRHEAVGTEPAITAQQDHVIASVLQPGYRFGGALIRPARVRVFVWQGDGEAQAGAESEE